MKPRVVTRRRAIVMMIAAAMVTLAACQQAGAPVGESPTSQQVTLSGGSEVPPVNTSASGSGIVDIRPDRTVSASITVTGMTPTVAHIHEGAIGTIGPAVIPLTRMGDNRFVAPENAKLTQGQYASYKAGRLYVNVHSVKFPIGEVRAQLKAN